MLVYSNYFESALQKGYSLRNFIGHSSMVTSLDFHPNKDDLICSCDNDGEIRYWSINNGSCTRVYKVDLLVSSNPIVHHYKVDFI